jgi:hypothetical protein
MEIDIIWRYRKIGKKNYLSGNNKVLELNESAAFIVKKLIDEVEEDVILSEMSKEFSIESDIAKKDYVNLIDHLIKIDVIVT